MKKSYFKKQIEAIVFLGVFLYVLACFGLFLSAQPAPEPQTHIEPSSNQQLFRNHQTRQKFFPSSNEKPAKQPPQKLKGSIEVFTKSKEDTEIDKTIEKTITEEETSLEQEKRKDGKMPDKAQFEPEKKRSGKVFTLNFQNTDIDLVLKFFSDLMGVSFLKSDTVRGNVTVISSVKMPVEDAMDILHSILEVKGFSMVKSGNLVKVIPKAETVQQDVETKVGFDTFRDDDQVIMQVIPIRYVSATEMQNYINPLISKGATIITNERINSLIITETASNINRILEIIDILDVMVYGDKMQIEIITLKYADEEELSEKLQLIFNAGKTAIIGKITIIPDKRLNSLIIVTLASNIDIIKELIERLDSEGMESGDNTRVFFLQNSEAKTMSSILKDLFNKKGDGAASSEVYGEVHIVTDERTNALIITTVPQNLAAIKRLIDMLDVRTAQVLIEVLIAEITLSKDTKMGLEWTAVETSSFSNSKLSATASQQWNLAGFISGGLNYSVVKNDAAFTALVQVLASDQKVNILSSPRILASNNQEAIIKIGEEVPVLKEIHYQEDEQGIRVPIPTYEYKSVTMDLIVTPRINTQKDVALSIKQSLKKIIGYVPELNNAPIIGTREAQTSVIVKDGQTIVIGGLMREDDSKTQTKIPFLGDIPVLGWLFKKQGISKEKTELMIFITPYVVTNSEEAEGLTKKQEAEIKLPYTPYRERANKSFKQGKIYYSEGKYEQAIAEWEKVINLAQEDKIAKKAEKYIIKARKKLGKTK